MFSNCSNSINTFETGRLATKEVGRMKPEAKSATRKHMAAGIIGKKKMDTISPTKVLGIRHTLKHGETTRGQRQA